MRVHCDSAGGRFRATVCTGNNKCDVIDTCFRRRKRYVCGIGNVKQIVVRVCDYPGILVSNARVAIQLHLLAQTVGGVASDAGSGGVEEADI